jgi:hypothetical protein
MRKRVMSRLLDVSARLLHLYQGAFGFVFAFTMALALGLGYLACARNLGR